MPTTTEPTASLQRAQNRPKTEHRKVGEGSVTLRPDGRWMARRTVDRRTYTAYSSVPGEKGRKAALRSLQDAVEAAQRRDYDGLSHERVPTVAEYVEVWTGRQALALRAGRIRKNTYDQRVWAGRYLVNAMGRRTLDKVRPSDMTSLMDSLLASGKAPATVHHVMRYAHRVFAQAVLDRHIRSNPVTEKPKVEVGLPDTFTLDETTCVLDALKESRYYVAFALQAVSGLRSGELLALTEDDLVLPDEGPGVVFVSKNWARSVGSWEDGRPKEGGWGLAKPKTRRGTRQVPIPEVMVSLLRDHISKTQEERATYGWPDDKALFVRELDGVRPDVQRLSTAFRKAVRACGLGEGRTLTPHHLRHSFITRLLVEGWSPAQVAAIAGHSAAVSINRYLGVVAAAEVAGITSITGRLLGG